MNKNILIVSSHYNEDLNWLINQEEYDYKIYTKNIECAKDYPKKNIFECVNKGNEASSYLTYIIENYNNLHDYIAFIHGHYTSYHQTDDILNLIRNSKLSGYESLNRKDFRNDLNNETKNIDFKKNWDIVLKYYNLLNIELSQPSRLEYTACGQFIVKKEFILRNKLQDYKNMLDWLINTDLETYYASRVFEHLWCYIMTHNEIES